MSSREADRGPAGSPRVAALEARVASLEEELRALKAVVAQLQGADKTPERAPPSPVTPHKSGPDSPAPATPPGSSRASPAVAPAAPSSHSPPVGLTAVRGDDWKRALAATCPKVTVQEDADGIMLQVGSTRMGTLRLKRGATLRGAKTVDFRVYQTDSGEPQLRYVHPGQSSKSNEKTRAKLLSCLRAAHSSGSLPVMAEVAKAVAWSSSVSLPLINCKVCENELAESQQCTQCKEMVHPVGCGKNVLPQSLGEGEKRFICITCVKKIKAGEIKAPKPEEEPEPEPPTADPCRICNIPLIREEACTTCGELVHSLGCGKTVTPASLGETDPRFICVECLGAIKDATAANTPAAVSENVGGDTPCFVCTEIAAEVQACTQCLKAVHPTCGKSVTPKSLGELERRFICAVCIQKIKSGEISAKQEEQEEEEEEEEEKCDAVVEEEEGKEPECVVCSNAMAEAQQECTQCHESIHPGCGKSVLPKSLGESSKRFICRNCISLIKAGAIKPPVSPCSVCQKGEGNTVRCSQCAFPTHETGCAKRVVARSLGESKKRLFCLLCIGKVRQGSITQSPPCPVCHGAPAPEGSDVCSECGRLCCSERCSGPRSDEDPCIVCSGCRK